MDDKTVTPKMARAIRAVIKQIDAYRGEEIKKGEHPLWLARKTCEMTYQELLDS